MIPIQLENVREVLCLGAHAGDLEMGCGGTVLKLLAARPQVEVHWVVLGAEGPRAEEARQAAGRILQGAGAGHVVIEGFREGFFPYLGAPIKERFLRFGETLSPDVIFTHRRGDLDLDRRLVWELTWSTFRDHVILEYEVPKYEGDLGHPNLYVPLDEPTARRKVHALVECYRGGQQRPGFAADTFWSLMSLRGLECNSPTKLAEGLYCRKMVM